MRAMLLRDPVASVERAAPLVLSETATPAAGDGELLVRVTVCGVCRTDLDIAEGRVAARAYPVIPGHQVVGRVEALGAGAREFAVGDRVGVAWIHSACGVCEFCRRGAENLCARFESTGCDANGGYAEIVTVPAAFAHAIPAVISDAHAAPLLCAGAIGWRSLVLSRVNDGDVIGLTGFGASAHIVLQMIRKKYPRSPVHVFARSPGERGFAIEQGATWAGATEDSAPSPLAAIIDTTPAWKPVVRALRQLAPGGRLVINAIRKERADLEELLTLDYARDLWMEREIISVANVTRADVRGMLTDAAAHGLRPTVEELPLEQANEALAWFRSGGAIRGAKVLRVASST